MNITAGEAPLIVVGLILYALLWFIVGRRTSRRRKRDARPVTPVGERPGQITGDVAAARMTPAEAMAHAAPVDAPPEMERLDVTAQIPQYDTIAIEATTEPPEPLELPATTPRFIAPQSYHQGTAAIDISTWRPPEPSVVLTLTWKRPGKPQVAGRWDITEPEPMPDEIAPLYHAMINQRRHEIRAARDERLASTQEPVDTAVTADDERRGGTITVAVKLDGRHTPDWEWTANDEWPRQSIDAIRQARDQLQSVTADA